MARKVPEANASSTADIAFLLLIFFLVSTTMNVDSGIHRTLPPIADEEQEDKGLDIKERNVLMVNVNHLNQVAMRGQRVDVSQIKDIAKEFIANDQNDPNMPEREAPLKPIELLPNYQVSKGVISLQNDRGTSYDMYIQVQNELTKAFNEVREEFALQRFGKEYSILPEEQRTAVNQAIPLKISEAEPRNLAN
ncbi:MAG: biopolymer transporter ExbD [Rikenellaceae bacterium]